MAIPTDIKTATAQNLDELISAEVRESKRIEYKRELLTVTSEQKQKFIRTIVSFANASGGDAVYGMEAKDGKPIAVHPLATFDPDKTILQLRDLLRSHVEPMLMGVEFQPVQITGGWALIIRVARSWNPPHMVKLDDNRFWARNEGGRVMMTVPEIRDAIVGAQGLSQRIQQYRAERLLAIQSGEIPFKTEVDWKAVFHVFPIASFAQERLVDLPTFQNEEIRPIVVEYGYGQTFDVDGVYCAETIRGEDRTCLAYSFVSRTGCIESVTCVDLREWKGMKLIMNPRFEKRYIDFMPQCRDLLRKLQQEPPFVLALSLLNVKDFFFHSGMNRPLSSQRKIRQSDLILRHVIMQSWDDKDEILLKPIFDALWNSCGLPRSFNYDKDGNWKPLNWD